MTRDKDERMGYKHRKNIMLDLCLDEGEICWKNERKLGIGMMS